MPVTEYACPPDKPTFGQSFPIRHCLVDCEHQCMAPPLMAAMHSNNQKNHHQGRYLSATALAGCVRKLNAERKYDYAEQFNFMYYAFRGTITHTVIENASTIDLGTGESLEDLGFLTEWRMQIGFCFEEGHGGFPLPPDADPSDLATFAQHGCPDCDHGGVPRKKQSWFILGGTLDSARALWDQFDERTGVLPVVLYDIKTMQEYAITYFIKGDPKNLLHPQVKDDYIRQAHVYKYLAERSAPPAKLAARGVRRLKFIQGHIQTFAMGNAPWTGSGTARFKDNYRNPLKDWPMEPIEFLPDSWTEQYIRERGRPNFEALVLGRTRGDVCEPDENSKGLHSWRCGFCAFVGSYICPNPRLEHTLIKEKGYSPDEAFDAAMKEPIDIPEDEVVPLSPEDYSNAAKFWLAADDENRLVAARPRTEKELRFLASVPTESSKAKSKAKSKDAPTDEASPPKKRSRARTSDASS